jgi:hypothetical protein
MRGLDGSKSDERLGARKRGNNHRLEKARKTYLLKHPLCLMCQA